MNDAAYRIMQLLQEDAQLSQHELAERLGISVGRVNYCLKGLVEKGHVKLENFRASRNKLRYAYVLTPAGLAERARVTRAFLRRRIEEYEMLHAEMERILAETGSNAETVLGPEILERLRVAGIGD